MIKSTSSEARLPKFRAQLYYLLVSNFWQVIDPLYDLVSSSIKWG